MKSLKLSVNGFEIKVTNEDYRMEMEAVKNGQVAFFGIEKDLENNNIVMGEKRISLSEDQAKQFNEFVSECTFRNLFTFDSLKEARSHQSSDSCGKIFLKDGKSCFYRYSN